MFLYVCGGVGVYTCAYTHKHFFSFFHKNCIRHSSSPWEVHSLIEEIETEGARLQNISVTICVYFVSVSGKQLYYKLRTKCQRRTSFYKNCWFIVRKSGTQKWWSGKGELLSLCCRWSFVSAVLIPCLPLCGQRPAVCGRAVLAIFLPHHRAARAPAGSGPLQGVPVTVLGLRNGAELGFCSGKLISVFTAHICAQELVSLLLLFRFGKDSNELWLLLNIEVWEWSLIVKPSMGVWSCELHGKLTPPSRTGGAELCI